MTARRSLIAAGLLVFTLGWLALATLADAQEAQSSSQKYQSVRTMGPIGYWPADEGTGSRLHDRSGNNHHGKIFHIAWQGGMLNFNGGYQWLEIPGQAVARAKAFSMGGWLFLQEGDYQRDGLLFMGMGYPQRAWRGKNFSLRVRTGRVVEVVSEADKDAVGSRAALSAIPERKWVHLFYTYEKGTGTLYINGKKIASKKGIPYVPKAEPLFVGSDASWWMLHPPGSRSLRGSVRQLVFFDRALKAGKVGILARTTHPGASPNSFAKTSKRVVRERSLRALIGSIRDKNAPHTHRAKNVLALAKHGKKATGSVPLLIAMLRDLIAQHGEILPRVDTLLRNALIKALIELDPGNKQVQKVLALALAKPVLQTVDLSAPHLSKVQKLFKTKRYMQALYLFRRLQKTKHSQQFFSSGDRHRDERGDIHDRSYTAVAEHNGFVYRLGVGKGFEGVEPVTSTEFGKAIDRLSGKFPSVKNWRKLDAANISRVRITKTDRKGKATRVFLGGKNFIFDGSDKKIKGWSVAVDQKGYIHIMGGQHNRPNPDSYIPGSWEAIGLSRDRKSADFPDQMYWVSTRPGDISSFEFVGQRNNSRQLPTDYFNYMNFIQDNRRALYVFGRINLAGFQSWGLFRYDISARRWRSISGKATDLLASANKNAPHWNKYLIRQVRGYVPDKPGDRALVWAWQPHFYNYIRSQFGIQFDRTNRMHLYLPIRGLDGDAKVIDNYVYAYSDDGGQSFHRADGSKVSLPLTVNPAPSHNADLRLGDNKQWWDLWRSLLRYAGYSN